MYEMTNQLMLSPRTTSLVLIFPLAVNLIYIPVLLKLLLLRMIVVMLNQTTLKPYASTREDIYTAGLRTFCVPSDARHVTSTSAPFDPTDPHLKYLYREIWKAPQNIIAKSQSILLSVIRAHFTDGLFTTLDKTFPGSDLLQKYWLYTTSRIHRDRRSIHAFQDKISVTPIPTAEAFNAVMTQSRLLEV